MIMIGGASKLYIRKLPSRENKEEKVDLEFKKITHTMENYLQEGEYIMNLLFDSNANNEKASQIPDKTLTLETFFVILTNQYNILIMRLFREIKSQANFKADVIGKFNCDIENVTEFNDYKNNGLYLDTKRSLMILTSNWRPLESLALLSKKVNDSIESLSDVKEKDKKLKERLKRNFKDMEDRITYTRAYNLKGDLYGMFLEGKHSELPCQKVTSNSNVNPSLCIRNQADGEAMFVINEDSDPHADDMLLFIKGFFTMQPLRICTLSKTSALEDDGEDEKEKMQSSINISTNLLVHEAAINKVQSGVPIEKRNDELTAINYVNEQRKHGRETDLNKASFTMFKDVYVLGHENSVCMIMSKGIPTPSLLYDDRE